MRHLQVGMKLYVQHSNHNSLESMPLLSFLYDLSVQGKSRICMPTDAGASQTSVVYSTWLALLPSPEARHSFCSARPSQ